MDTGYKYTHTHTCRERERDLRFLQKTQFSLCVYERDGLGNKEWWTHTSIGFMLRTFVTRPCTEVEREGEIE